MMKKQSPTIVLTGGGSGGHITPLLSLARELKLKDPNCQIVYIGHKGDRFDRLQQSSKDFDFTSFIDGGKFRRYHGESLISHLLDIKTLLLNFRDLFKVLTSVGMALKILRKVKPDVVFSKGGFVVVPVGIAAKILRIPIVTHDSDTVPGLANRIVGRWAAVNATGMPAKYYSYPQERIRFVGVPVADLKPLSKTDLLKLKQELKIPAAAKVLLLSGGGNGSKRLNDLLSSIAPQLLKDNLALYIVHVSGQKHEQAVRHQYSLSLDKTELKRVFVIGFTSEFQNYTAIADLIIARAGATSLAEFAMLKKACIVIPSPFLAGGHQLKNAEELVARDAAAVVGEDISADELLALVAELLNNDDRRRHLGENLSTLARPNATKELADIILEQIKKGSE